MIKVDFAPLEGITDSIYRKAHHTYFGGVDRYFMPFLSPTMHNTLTHKEDRELPLADSVSFRAVPQILTKVPADFLWAAQVCADRGYEEVNLNIGCPSGTVVAKGKGAGMLANVDYLDNFFEEIFSKSPISVSVKTRIGMTDEAEFPRLVDIFNPYPIKELIVHPRIRTAFYKGDVDMEAFRYCVEVSKNPVRYNGDILSRITNDVDTIGQSLNQSVGTLINAICLFLGSLITLCKRYSSNVITSEAIIGIPK